MENIEEEMPCPVCKLVVVSDANTLKYCKTCGMNIANDPILVKRHNRKFYFCSDYCKNVFLRTGFKIFQLNKTHRVN